MMQYTSVPEYDVTTDSGCSQPSLDQSNKQIEPREVDEHDTCTNPNALHYRCCHDETPTKSDVGNPRSNGPSSKNVLIVAGILLSMVIFATLRVETITRTSTTPNDGPFTIRDTNVTMLGYFRYNKIIGHLHMAKTAGTEINGELAAHYERVCGNKGYSYDSFQANERLRDEVSREGEFVTLYRQSDIISEWYPDHNRGRVPAPIMDEIGFEDCDYISLEKPWNTWIDVAKIWPLELHVPCRDPLKHLMSQCNHQHLVFDCEASDLRDQVSNCLTRFERFSTNLAQVQNLTLKCFNPIPIQPYLQYMDHILERKRLETNYIHRDTNDPRHEENECIWNSPLVAKRVLDILNDYEYYQWCQDCMGSENNLLLGHS